MSGEGRDIAVIRETRLFGTADGGTTWTPVDVNPFALTAASGSTSASGNTTCLTPASGKKLRLSYVAYNPSASVEAAFRFGAAGALFLRNSLTQAGSVIAKDFGDRRYLEGAVDAPLYLNLSAAVPVIWNAFYVET